jgi:uncharacterized membrane protein
LNAPSLAARTGALFRGEPTSANAWIFARGAGSYAEPLLLLGAGSAIYGAAMGAWRDPLLAGYVAIKLPLLLVLTTLTNAIVNALTARLLGLELTFAQSLRTVMLSFGVAGVVLASLAPIVFFFDLALPGPMSGQKHVGHDVLGLSHVGAIALAGIAAVRRQQRWLREAFPSSRSRGQVVLAWLAVNLIVGAQISWNLRPWFGTPVMRVQFLRDDPFDGTFYESVFRMVIDHLR